MILDVPLITQEKGSQDCGIACLLMILEFLGIKKSFTDLKKELEVDEVGSYTPQMGTYLQRAGFSTELVTQHPGLFTLKDRGKSQTEILLRIKDLLSTAKTDQNKKVLQYFLEYLENGGQISVKIPEIGDITESINNNQPLIALLTSHFLTETLPKFNLHFNIVTGFDETHVYLNDPLPDQRGGKKKCSVNDFFYGVHASTYADIDNGCLLKIKKRQ